MMIDMLYGWSIALLILLALTFLAFFFWTQRFRTLKLAEERKRLREKFSKLKKRRPDRTHPKDSHLLDGIVERVQNAAEEAKDTVEIPLEKDIELRSVASDLIELRTPRCILHKSFEKIRFENIEKTKKGYKLDLTTDQSKF